MANDNKGLDNGLEDLTLGTFEEAKERAKLYEQMKETDEYKRGRQFLEDMRNKKPNLTGQGDEFKRYPLKKTAINKEQYEAGREFMERLRNKKITDCNFE